MDTRFGQSWLIRAGLLLLVLPALRNPGKRRSPLGERRSTRCSRCSCLATFTFAEHARTGPLDPPRHGHGPRAPRIRVGVAGRRRRPRDAARPARRAARRARDHRAVLADRGAGDRDRRDLRRGPGVAADRRPRFGVRHHVRAPAAHEDRARRDDRRRRERQPAHRPPVGRPAADPRRPGRAAGRSRSRGRARAAQRGRRRGGDRGDRAARDRAPGEHRAGAGRRREHEHAVRDHAVPAGQTGRLQRHALERRDPVRRQALPGPEGHEPAHGRDHQGRRAVRSDRHHRQAHRHRAGRDPERADDEGRRGHRHRGRATSTCRSRARGSSRSAPCAPMSTNPSSRTTSRSCSRFAEPRSTRHTGWGDDRPDALLACARRRPRAVRRVPAGVQAARRPARALLRARPRRRRRRAHDLRPVERLLRRPDREEAAQPLPARLDRCSRSAPPAATSRAASARTGTSRSRRRSTRSPTRRTPDDARRRGTTSSAAAASRSPTTTRRSSWSTRSTSPTRAARRASRASPSPPATSARAAPRDVRAHGRRQRRPQGVHRGLLPHVCGAHLRRRARHARVPRARDRRVGRDHDAADPGQERRSPRRSTR